MGRNQEPFSIDRFLRKLILFSQIQAKKVVCGDDFTVVLAADGKLYNFGRGDMAAMGNGKSKHINMPRLLDKDPFGSALTEASNVKELSCGSSHCLAVRIRALLLPSMSFPNLLFVQI